MLRHAIRAGPAGVLLEHGVLSEATDWMRTCGRLPGIIDEYLREDKATMETPPIVSPQEWDAAREELLAEERS